MIDFTDDSSPFQAERPPLGRVHNHSSNSPPVGCCLAWVCVTRGERRSTIGPSRCSIASWTSEAILASTPSCSWFAILVGKCLMLSARDIKAIWRYRGCHCRKPLALDISRLSLPPNCQTDSHVVRPRNDFACSVKSHVGLALI